MPSTMDPVVEALQHLLKHPYAQAIRRLIYSKSIHEAMAEPAFLPVMVALALMAIPLLLPSSKPVELVTERKVNARAISKSEVAQHKREGDCWVSMEGKVYDISNYVEEHPGGETAILKYAGRDVSVPFRGPQHGSQVDDVIANYYIGTLE